MISKVKESDRKESKFHSARKYSLNAKQITLKSPLKHSDELQLKSKKSSIQSNLFKKAHNLQNLHPTSFKLSVAKGSIKYSQIGEQKNHYNDAHHSIKNSKDSSKHRNYLMQIKQNLCSQRKTLIRRAKSQLCHVYEYKIMGCAHEIIHEEDGTLTRLIMEDVDASSIMFKKMSETVEQNQQSMACGELLQQISTLKDRLKVESGIQQ